MGLTQQDIRWILTAVVCITFFVPKVCFPQTRFVLKPSISASWHYDSNFYKTEDSKAPVYTYRVQPGISIGYETAKSFVDLNYSLQATEYRDVSDTPEDGAIPADRKDYIGQMGVLKMRTAPFDRLILGLDDSYYLTRDQTQSDPYADVVTKDRYSINRFTPLVYYEFENRFSAGLRYRYTTVDYSESLSENAEEHRAMLDLIYNLSRSSLIDVDYQHWQRRYNQSSSGYRSDQIHLILKKEYKYFTFQTGGGFHSRTFEQSYPENIETATYHVSVKGQFPAHPEPKPRSYVNVDLQRNLNDSGSGDIYYITRLYRLELGHIFLKKIMTNINGCYKTSHYKTMSGLTPDGDIEFRQDDTLSCSLRLDYLLTEGLTFRAEAGREIRNSNLSGYDYKDSYLSFELNFEYDISSN